MKVLSLATLLGLLSPNTPDTEEQMSALAQRKFTVHNKCSFTIWYVHNVVCLIEHVNDVSCCKGLL